jgi:hypothetical protein
MLDPVANLIKLQLNQGYDQNATSIVVTSGGSSLPSPSFNVVWWNSTDYPDPSNDPNVEIVRVTAVSSNTLTVTRAQEGTAASTKNTAGKTYQLILGITAKMITDIQSAINAVVVGYRPSVANFTTVLGANSFTITPPSGSVTSILMCAVGTQQFVPGGDVTLSGNVASFAVNYPQAGVPVVIIYTY